MSKTIWIIANWKSNKTISEVLDWISKVGPEIPQDEGFKVVVCPTFSALSEVKKAITVGNFPLLLGAQDLSPFGTGAYTGEETASLLKDFISLSIIGHSERRSNFSETDEIVNKKIGESLREGIKPIVCVSNIGQVRSLVPGNYIIAYEPISAIGTGNPEDPNTVLSIIKQIKEIKDTEVLYGGSVNPQNIKDYTSLDNISGVLVGNSSLDAELFLNLIKNAE